MTLSIAISCLVLYKLIVMKSKVERKHGNWMVYILRCADGSFYTGATNNLEKRLTGHNRGTASKYTRARLPVQLLATSAKMNKSEALRLEMKIKKLPRAKKLAAFNDLLYNSVIDIT